MAAIDHTDPTHGTYPEGDERHGTCDLCDWCPRCEAVREYNGETCTSCGRVWGEPDSDPMPEGRPRRVWQVTYADPHDPQHRDAFGPWFTHADPAPDLDAPRAALDASCAYWPTEGEAQDGVLAAVLAEHAFGYGVSMADGLGEFVETGVIAGTATEALSWAVSWLGRTMRDAMNGGAEPRSMVTEDAVIVGVWVERTIPTMEGGDVAWSETDDDWPGVKATLRSHVPELTVAPDDPEPAASGVVGALTPAEFAAWAAREVAAEAEYTATVAADEGRTPTIGDYLADLATRLDRMVSGDMESFDLTAAAAAARHLATTT